MENFILYEEIGTGSNSIVYKGRRKGTINFLAILCIDKIKRAPITNWVRITHELKHDNIVKFYEWYETSKHLWMIVELCTGGTLQKVLDQDGFLPEEIIRLFCKDIVAGLKHLHDLGIIFANLSPKKILLDGPGVLKITNFGIARSEDEDLRDVYEQACAQHDGAEYNTNHEILGDVEFQAPEILKGGSPSLESDVWSLGVMMYYMFTGSLPFTGENRAELVQHICHEHYEDPDKKRQEIMENIKDLPSELISEKASKSFLNLIKKMMAKNPSKRPNIDEIMIHPFWKNEKTALSANNEEDKLAVTKDLLKSSLEKSLTPNRVNTAPERVDALDSTFTLSSRPHTAMAQSLDTRVLNNTLSPMGKTFTVAKGKQTSQDSTSSSVKSKKRNEVTSSSTFTNLIYHASDCEVTVIQDNPQIGRVEPLRWDAKSIPFHTFSSMDGISNEEINMHVKEVTDVLSKNPGSQPKQKTHIVSYLGHLCTLSSTVATSVINSPLLQTLANIVRGSCQNSPELSFKAARAIGLAGGSTTELHPSTRLHEIFSAFSEALRENFKSTRAKQALIPALGQLLFLIVEQTEGNDLPLNDNWTVPNSIFLLFTRCLREGEDSSTQHAACKTIEIVCNTSPTYGKRFMSSGSQQSGNGGEVTGTLLWTIANRAPNENLKQSAMSAVCQLNKLSSNGSVFHAVLDKIGLPQVLLCLQRCSMRCVQSLVTCLVETLHSAPRGQATRLAAGKNLLPTLIKLLDNPSSVVRAKVFLTLLELMTRNNDMMLASCQLRLVMYIERDIRKGGKLDGENPDNLQMTLQSEYLQSTLTLLVNHLTKQAPNISSSCVELLEETLSRKHPSTNQIKQLKSVLPNVAVLMYMVTSQVFRHELVTSDFIFTLGKLLSHVIRFLQTQALPSGFFQTIGDEISQNYIDSVLMIVECLSQHPIIITQHQQAAMEALVPRLVVLLGVYNKEGKAMCIKLLNEILGTLLHNKLISQESSQTMKPKISSDDLSLCDLIVTNLLPEYQPILLGQEPLPVYGVHLLITLVEHWPLKMCASIHENGLLPIILQIYNEQRCAMLGSCAIAVAALLTATVMHGSSESLMDMYDNGLVDLVTSYTVEISCQYIESHDSDNREFVSVAMDAVVQQFSLLKEMLSFVASDIKRTIQNKAKQHDSMATDMAERLLVINKPLTDLQGLCMQMLCGEEEIAELAMANLSLLVQLFGGDHPETMAEENMDCLAEALQVCAPRLQKVLLKAIKRIVSLHKVHATTIYGSDGHSGSLITVLRMIAHDNKRKTEPGIEQLAREIIECVEVASS